MPGFKAGPNESLESTRAQAKCVARIILTPERMLALHQAVGRNLQRFKDKLMATQQTTPEPDTEKSTVMSFDYDPTISKAPIARVESVYESSASLQPHDTSGDYLLYNRKTSESRIVSEADALILGGNTVQAFRALAAKLTEIHPATVSRKMSSVEYLILLAFVSLLETY